ncbi:MAG: hypothetical protein KBB52_03645 [Candidatus Omnitrophica bacterium]|nr:hypothetical protein [Candidatus Omnitrophota bacterium]
MPRALSLLVISVFIFFVSTAPSYSQETEGLIPRLMKKFQKKEEAPKKAAETKSSVPAVPKMPASGPGGPAGMPPKGQGPMPQVPGPVTPAGEAGRTVTPGVDKMTKEELLKDITEELMGEAEIFDYIPQLKPEKDAAGNKVITYEAKGRRVKLEELDRDTLAKLYTMVNQVSTKINVDRINQQLETIRQTQNIQRITQPPTVVTAPPRPPQVQTLPSPPPQAPPTTPPQVPRVPQPPPQPPRRQ